MKAIKAFATAGLTAIAMSTAAVAADFNTDYSPVASPLYGEPVFDWEGFYLGVQKGWWIGAGNFSAAAVAGVNFMPTDNLLVGAEASVGAVTDFTDVELETYLRGRLGLVLGDDILLYKLAEVGLVGGTTVYGLGGGIEFALGASTSVRAEVTGIGDFGGGFNYVIASGGLLWHLN